MGTEAFQQFNAKAGDMPHAAHCGHEGATCSMARRA